MTYLVSEGLVLLQIYEEVLFVMFQVSLADFGYVFLDVWEGICYVFLAPGTRVKEDVYYCLFLYKHFVGFVQDSAWNCACLRIIDAVWRWLPVVLNRDPVRISYESEACVCCLHSVT